MRTPTLPAAAPARTWPAGTGAGWDGPGPWTLPAAEVVARTGADPVSGLPEGEAAARLAADGPNEVATEPPVSLLRSVLAQPRDTLILVLLAAAVLTAATGDLVDTAVIGLVVVVNTTLGVVQERRALRAVAALSRLVAPSARVLRGGRDTWVPTRDLVRGDVLRLTAGDVVGADARLLRSTRLQVDESPLTGESLPVDRTADSVSPADAPPADRSGMVHAGTTVVRGTGEAVVVATGAASAVGRVAALVQRRSPLTPLQRRLSRLGRQISLAVAVACLLFVASGLLRGQPWETTVVAGVAGVALTVAASCLLVAVVARAQGGPWQTQLFVALTAGQPAVALAMRPAGAWRAGRWLPVAALGSAALLAAAVYAAPLQDLLGTEALGVAELATALVAALPPALGPLLLRGRRRGRAT
ncbi:ATPase, P-type (transporting), HAD superfamily, subfamily IC [Geodermatophilus saharensis]|uniref:ATPase, P-type (Transporting), HAD superfamily, subfamily IC n=1 Tax=Geodermatophilus saharensis TaxID=1137994 RepID=A0A239BW73_9ACTN|nr:HAD-IC family P-type ATPase [Geodermatophilus saharensis]SNS11681.1 ATPase, P-type (transporting), HAD superfamily, subfamily IC [Geodermatophilus saharensis]